MCTASHSGFDFERVHTLDDLRHWQRRETSLAVLGQPIRHSRSPRMQNAALDALAPSVPSLAGWRYFKFEIEPENLGEALTLFHQHRFQGLNLTLPHKVLACEHVTRCEGIAGAIGAVNTLLREADGYAGYNTDGTGFERAVRETLGVALRGAAVVLLGAGGAARAVAAAALDGGCRALLLGNRGTERREALVALLNERFPATAGAVPRVRGFSLEALPADIPADALVVNATALGLKPDDASPVPSAFWRSGMSACDIVYGAGETAFLREAREAGVVGTDGLAMLCWQGALAFELWTGRPAPVAVMMQALKSAS
ncbi:MAG: shikimate dehydrogenase [Puniceicoccales bacterium]|jgi:shikimate dehydrogenase|nr:shikimate dehydrogenase [Puniceicoccales bacterium]